MSSGGGLQAELEAMRQAIPAVERGVSALTQANRNVDAAMQNVGAGWTSDGATFFRAVMQDFSAEYTKMINDLAAIHEALSGNQVHYTASAEQERAAVNRFNSLLS
jgi:WXG100 family type VII secretion target